MRADAIVAFERTDPRRVDQFQQQLERFARDRGVLIGRREGGFIDGSSVANDGSKVEQLLEHEMQRLGTRIGLVVCIMGDKDAVNAKELYPAIKRWSHVKACIPTQCVQAGKALGKLATSAPYYAGILLKINLKLGGVNAHTPSPSLALLRAAETMVMGFDVNHPQPGSPKPSYSALCATMDPECTSYFTVIGPHSSPPLPFLVSVLRPHLCRCTSPLLPFLVSVL